MSSDLLIQSKKFLAMLWTCSADDCMGELDKDFTLIGPFAQQGCNGQEQLASFCGRAWPILKHLGYEISDYQERRQDASTVVSILIGKAFALSAPSSTVTIRCSFVWSQRPRRYLLSHAHLSVPLLLYSPLGLTRMQEASLPGHLSAPSKEDKPYLTLRDSDGAIHILLPRHTLYLESRHQYTLVHTKSRQIKVRSSLTAMLNDFPPYFVRVHRSYAVNVLLVSKISTRELTLSTGEEVPIPTKSVTKVRAMILDALNETFGDATGDDASPSSLISEL